MNDTSLQSSIDSRQMVKNLCCSNGHILQQLLVIKKIFRIIYYKQWIDGGEWKNHFDCYYELSSIEKKVIKDALLQSSLMLLLRNWQEVVTIFLDCLQHSP